MGIDGGDSTHHSGHQIHPPHQVLEARVVAEGVPGGAAALRYWRRRSVIDGSKPSGGDTPSASTVLVTDNVNVSPLI